MPQNFKTSVNNLIVVWQGSNWSVISPDGEVLFRHWSKSHAIDWARQNSDYAHGSSGTHRSTSEENVEDVLPHESYPESIKKRAPTSTRIIFPEDLQSNHPKYVFYLLFPYLTVIFKGLIVVAIFIALVSFCASINYVAIAETVSAQVSQINWFGLIVLALIIIGTITFVHYQFEEGCGSGVLGCLLIIGAVFLCNAIGILGVFLNWVF